MTVIGAEHAQAHARAGGRRRGDRPGARPAPDQGRGTGHLAAVRWTRGLDGERVRAVEDCHHVSRRLEQALLRPASGSCGWLRTGWAPPGWGSASRASRTRSTRSRSPAVVGDGVESFPPPTSTSRRWRSGCSPTTARIWSPSAPECRTGCAGICSNSAPSVAREQVRQIRLLTRQVGALERELLALVKAHRPQLLAETRCGPLTAAILVGPTAGAERFRSDAGFARQTGTAPIPCSTGQRERHRLNRGGDRQLKPRAAHHRDQPRPPRPEYRRSYARTASYAISGV
jgi:transposase